MSCKTMGVFGLTIPRRKYGGFWDLSKASMVVVSEELISALIGVWVLGTRSKSQRS